MSSYVLSLKAENDIDDIVDYTLEVWGEAQTYNYVSDLINTLQLLSDQPEIGRSATEFSAFLKKYNFKAHTIFFESTKKGIFIVRILGKRQDFEKYL